MAVVTSRWTRWRWRLRVLIWRLSGLHAPRVLDEQWDGFSDGGA